MALVKEWKDARGSFRLEMIARNGVLIVPQGHQTGAAGEVQWAGLEECLSSARGPLYFFGDGLDLTTYDTAYRNGYTEWFRKHRTSFAELHVITRSSFVRLATSLINLAVNGVLTAHKDEGSFFDKMRTISPNIVWRGRT